jgi:hypothetical protein
MEEQCSNNPNKRTSIGFCRIELLKKTEYEKIVDGMHVPYGTDNSCEQL